MAGCYLGLVNTTFFNEKVQEKIEKNKHKMAVVALDISNFKYINDFYGMDEGDRVMQDIADFFFVDITRCIAAHGLGFDQFRAAYSIDGMEEQGFLDFMIYKKDEFEKQLMKRYPLVYHHVYLGIYFCESTNLDVRMAVDKANLAKKSIKGRFDIPCRVYSDDNCEAYFKHMDMANTFEKASKEGRIELFIQPKVSAKLGQTVGGEALVRMRGSEGELIPPGMFIPVLEDTGMIGKLDKIMIEKVFAFQRECVKKGYNVVPISVNVSRQMFISEGFLEFVMGLKKKYEVDPSLIEFEILETIFINSLELMVDVIEALRKEGFRINVDDFGSGYSSLNQIANIPADIIKIDRVFASKSLKTEKGRRVIKSIIDMLNSVEYELVFEGIETKEELDLVTAYGCDLIQGYYYSPPIPAMDFENKNYN